LWSDLSIANEKEILLPVTIIFCTAILVSGLTRLYVLRFVTDFAFSTGAEISQKIYSKTLYQDYSIHSSRNTSKVINTISNKTNGVIYNTLIPTFNLINSAIMFSIILLSLVILNPTIAITTLLTGSIFYIILILIFKSRIKAYSKTAAINSDLALRNLNEGLGGIRDILLDNTQDLFCKQYTVTDNALRHSQKEVLFLGAAPRYVLEIIGLTLIALISYNIVNKNANESLAVPIIGLIAMTAQKILPLLQLIYASWTNIIGDQSSFEDVLMFMEQKTNNNELNKITRLIQFKNTIELIDVSYIYPASKNQTLTNVNISIPKGSRVGIIGPTGSGKSTLTDIIMTLLYPTSGKILIDGVTIDKSNSVSWQKLVSHVPQSIYLSDQSVIENVAFGVELELIDTSRVVEACKKADLHDTIMRLPNKYNTIVGERGINLSGGQKQRIGIARALYKSAELIILDEATSALDNETERVVINSINQLDKNITVIMIAHRLTTLSSCDILLKVKDGFVEKIKIM
jgi:ATP-binding cassette subfamily B protein